MIRSLQRQLKHLKTTHKRLHEEIEKASAIAGAFFVGWPFWRQIMVLNRSIHPRGVPIFSMAPYPDIMQKASLATISTVSLVRQLQPQQNIRCLSRIAGLLTCRYKIVLSRSLHRSWLDHFTQGVSCRRIEI